ncbi:polysaccharide pyruvyl transferase family protein [Ponticaulis profundi]
MHTAHSIINDIIPSPAARIGFVGNPAYRAEGANDNTGNFLHGFAARYIVGEHRNVDAYMDSVTDEIAEKLKSELTHIAFVAANNIRVGDRTSLISSQKKLADAFEKLQLPIIVFGLGAQAPIGQSISESFVAPETKRLLSVISHHAPKIAVRGEFTADLCKHLGIDNVEVIGCQSCFISRRSEFRLPELMNPPRIEKTVVNVTYPEPEIKLIKEALASNSTFIGQTERFEYEIAKIERLESVEDIPSEILSLIRPGLMRAFTSSRIDFKSYHEWIKKSFHQFYSMPPWFEKFKEGYDACIGTRFHGNMAAMQAGVPSLWIVHDSRTQEFCDHLGLPQAPLKAVQDGMPIAELFDRHYETKTFARKYPQNYARFYDYLTEHDVPHKLAAPVAN